MVGVLFLKNPEFLIFRLRLKHMVNILIYIICFIVCLLVIEMFFLLVFLCMEILAVSLLTLLTLSILCILLRTPLDSCLWKSVLRLTTIFVLGLLLVYLAFRLAALPFLLLLLLINL